MKVLRQPLLGRELVCQWERLDDGLQVLLTGGDQSHVGAISVAESDGRVQTLTFPGHKDQYVSEPWATALAKLFECRTAVTCGIHYDNLSKEGIAQVLTACQDLLAQLQAAETRAE